MAQQIMLLQIALNSGYNATQLAEMASLLYGAAEYDRLGWYLHSPFSTKLAGKGFSPVWFSTVCFFMFEFIPS